MLLDEATYLDKVLGCFLGKNIGGTLGAPFEWKRQINEVKFYTQDLHGDPLPNDDLDIQLLWLVALEEKGVNLNSRTLAEYWQTFVTPHWAEYGAAKANLRSGLLPPLSGWNANPYRHSCGSYIRSEIWACVAPGQPELAARYAYEDAIIDHGNGEGVYAEIFMAALESAAFLHSDLRELIKIGLSYIPLECGIAAAVQTACDSFDAGKPWRETRDDILRHHRGTFGGIVSAEDEAQGFRYSDNSAHGEGYDAASNVAITIAGLLYGAEDFGAVQCIAVNMGEDTDCTAATAGSVWGIIHGAKNVPPQWIKPIGHGIKTVTLCLGELGFFGDQLPATVDDLTRRAARIAKQMWAVKNRDRAWLDFAAVYGNHAAPEKLRSTKQGANLYECPRGPRFDFDVCRVDFDYLDGATITPGAGKKIVIKIINWGKVKGNLALKWYLPRGWRVSPAPETWGMAWNWKPLTLTYEFFAPENGDGDLRATNRLVLEIIAEGHTLPLLMPVTLLSAARE